MVGETFEANLTRLRILLILDLIFFAFGVLFIFIDPALLPPELKKYSSLIEDDSNSEKLNIAIGMAVFYACIIAPWLISIIGLWRLRRWARMLYTLFVFVLLFWGLFGGADVESAFSSVVGQLDAMAEGAILLMVWFIMKGEFASAGAS
jgi:hypothetical protein